MVDWFKGKVSAVLVEKYKIPKFLLDMFSTEYQYAFQGLLQLNWLVAKPYTPERYIDEMYGISTAAGVPFEFVVQANMLPELTRASCTIVGAWANSTVGQ